MDVALLVPQLVDGAVPGLADLLIDCVDGGASVGFLAPLAREHAEQWWGELLRTDGIRAWVAFDGDRSVVGCVLLSLASPDNARHRAEVRKLLVHRSARGRGVASRLMDRVEEDAAALGRTLLLLDTETGSSAETLYRGRGWAPFGVVPDHARRPDGTLADTTFMLKTLVAPGKAWVSRVSSSAS